MITIRLQAGPERRPAAPRDRPVQDGDASSPVPPAARREVPRDRRAGGERGARRRRAGLDLRPARRGAAGDGGDAGAGVPDPAAAAAAGARAGRGRDHLRGAVAGRREPDDGLDRGAAGADRPGGGLRDPVPRPLRRERTRTADRARGGRGGRGARAGRRSSRPGVATAVGFLVLLLSPIPMVRGFGALLVVGHRARARLRDLRRLRRARALRVGASRLRRRCRACAARWPPSAPSARRRAARVDRRPRLAGARLGAARARAGCWRSGWRVAVAGLALDTQSEVVSDVRELVPRRPAGAQGRERAPEGDRRVGRDRRDRARRRHHRRRR